MALRIRTGSLYFLRPVSSDASEARIACWKDYLVRVIQSEHCPRYRTSQRCHVQTRQGEFIGLVLLASLHPLDRKTRNALRREARRATRTRK